MKKLFLATALSLVLTACGGGGGSSGSGESSAALTLNEKGIRSDLVESVKALKKIEIEGKSLSFYDEPVGFLSYDFGNKIGRGYNQAYSVMGYLLPKDVKTGSFGNLNDSRVSKSDIDAFGLETQFANIPKSGIAVYQGGSIGADSQGKLTLNVNFDIKTVSGKLHDRVLLSENRPLANVELRETKIDKFMYGGSEAHFAGTAFYTDQYKNRHGGGATVWEGGYGGKFMGPNAEEVVGVVIDNEFKIYEGFAGKK